jgi:hypothetical protein
MVYIPISLLQVRLEINIERFCFPETPVDIYTEPVTTKGKMQVVRFPPDATTKTQLTPAQYHRTKQTPPQIDSKAGKKKTRRKNGQLKQIPVGP